MAVSPASTVQQARSLVAARLREIRLDAGLTARALAANAGWHASKCSRIEHTRTPPSDADIRAWCRICGADDQIQDLIASSRAADSMYTEWRRIEVTGLRRVQETNVPLYERTQRFRLYQSHVVPGLLQAPGYTHALLSSITSFRDTRDDARDATAARLERSRIVHDGQHRFDAVIEEAVLRYQVGSPEQMARQLSHLLSLMPLRSISLSIIPFSAPRSIWTVEGFVIFDDARVDVELLSALVTITQPRELAIYMRAFSQLEAIAVRGHQARELVLAAIDAL